MTVVDAPSMATILTRAAFKVVTSARKRMCKLHVQPTLRDDSEVEMADATAEDEGVKECALPFSEVVDTAYAVVSRAKDKVCAILDVGIDYVLGSYDNTTVLSLEGEIYMPCIYPP